LVIARELWLMTHLSVEVKDVKTKEKDTKTDNKTTQWTKEEWSKNLEASSAGKWLRLWLGERSIGWTSDLEELLSSMSVKCQDDLKAEVERRLK